VLRPYIEAHLYLGIENKMSRRTISLPLAVLSVLFFLGLPALVQAQPTAIPSAPATQAQIAALQQSVQNAQSAGDNAWMLMSAALVLLMTGPGLALYYGGLVRRKNILSTMMQSFAMMSLVTILWAIAGYSLAFGHGNSLHRRLRASLPPRSWPCPKPRLRAHHS
jgi:Amt family ammonium transporter